VKIWKKKVSFRDQGLLPLMEMAMTKVSAKVRKIVVVKIGRKPEV